jgi:hypothetical protein
LLAVFAYVNVDPDAETVFQFPLNVESTPETITRFPGIIL